LVVGAVVTPANGTDERTAALAMRDTVPDTQPKSVGADKAYDTRDFIDACRQRNIVPHVACNGSRRGGSAISPRSQPKSALMGLRNAEMEINAPALIPMSTDATITRNHAYRDSGFSSLSIRLLPSYSGTMHGGKKKGLAFASA
jgi:hypothetical protein